MAHGKVEKKGSFSDFDPTDYLDAKFQSSASAIIKEETEDGEEDNKGKKSKYEYSDFMLKNLSNFYGEFAPESDLKVLDYGCGPTLAFSISAAPKARRIVLADYSQSSLDSIAQWLERDPCAYNWTPTFEHVLRDLEDLDGDGDGNSAEFAAAIAQREECLRRSVEGMVRCDVRKDDFLAERYIRIYDVVMCFLCLESAFEDRQGYKSGIEKLSSLLEVGGYLLLSCALREGRDASQTSYFVRGVEFNDVVLDKDFVLGTLKECGFKVAKEDYLPLPPDHFENCDGFLFIVAEKETMRVTRKGH